MANPWTTAHPMPMPWVVVSLSPEAVLEHLKVLTPHGTSDFCGRKKHKNAFSPKENALQICDEFHQIQ